MTTRSRFFDYAVTKDGNTVTVLPYAEVTLYDAETNDALLDTIYDADGGTKVNPFITDEFGTIEFYLDQPKRVKITYEGTTIATDLLEVDNEPVLPDPATYIRDGITTLVTLDGGLIVNTGDGELINAQDDYINLGDGTLYVDQFGQKVGIKTETPDAELHILGDLLVESSLVDQFLVNDTGIHYKDASDVTIFDVDPDGFVQLTNTLYVPNHVAVLPVSGKLGLASTSTGHLRVRSSDNILRELIDTTNYARSNYIDNCQFNVLTRKTMPTADNSMAFDRWKLLLGAANAATISQETSDLPAQAQTACKLTVGSSPGNKFGIWQSLPTQKVARLAGKSVCMQLTLKVSNTRIGIIKVAIAYWTQPDNSTLAHNPITSWNGNDTAPTLSIWALANTPTVSTNGRIVPITAAHALHYVESLTIPSTITSLGVFIWCDDTSTNTGDTVIIGNVKLEENDICSNFEPKSLQEELQAARYFLQAFGGFGTTSPFEALGSASDADNADFGPILKRDMRIAPALVSGYTLADWTISPHNVTPTSISLIHSSPTALWLRCVKVGAFAAKDAIALLPTPAGGYTQLLFSAEM